MKIVEILGDSVREDLNFVGSKIKDLPKNKTVYFVFKNLRDIIKIKEAPTFSKIEIDTKNENRYEICVKNREHKIYFVLSKNLEKFEVDYLFLADLEKFEKAKNVAREKLFLLTTRKKETKKLEEIREKLDKDLEIIQLGLPGIWIDF